MALCDADTFNCWGWKVYGVQAVELTSSVASSAINYSAVFASGLVYEAFAAASPTTTQVKAFFGSAGPLEDVSVSASIAGYGFNDIYWFTAAVTTADWPVGDLAYRFQAVDLPRYSGGDSMSIWSLGSVTASSANNVGPATFVLANAQMIAATTAAVLVCSTLL